MFSVLCRVSSLITRARAKPSTATFEKQIRSRLLHVSVVVSSLYNLLRNAKELWNAKGTHKCRYLLPFARTVLHVCNEKAAL